MPNPKNGFVFPISDRKGAEAIQSAHAKKKDDDRQKSLFSTIFCVFCFDPFSLSFFLSVRRASPRPTINIPPSNEGISVSGKTLNITGYAQVRF